MGFEIDHIISLKHGGGNAPENLAFTCLYCNQNKGSDIGTVLLPAHTFVRLYNPRKDIWHEHFEISGALILSKTEVGEATIKILKFNDVERIIERQNWLDSGMFPHSAATMYLSQ
jgi:homogentisate 1,2-dioxygenase